MILSQEPITLDKHLLKNIKAGTRVQSFNTTHDGEITLVDVEAKIVWIKWKPNMAILPHKHPAWVNDIFPVDL